MTYAKNYSAFEAEKRILLDKCTTPEAMAAMNAMMVRNHTADVIAGVRRAKNRREDAECTEQELAATTAQPKREKISSASAKQPNVTTRSRKSKSS